MAKATIGHLRAILSLNTSKFSKGLRTSRASLKAFGKSITAIGVRVAKFGAVMGAVASGAMVLLVKKSFTAIEALAKTSDKLGIATEKLVAFQFAAKLSGVETNTFNMALQRMVRRISEAAKGTGEARDAIKELGLNAKKLGNLSVGRQFEAIADAMEKIEKQSDRVRLAFKLFDSEGVALVNTLKGGSRALRQAQREVRALGIAVSRFDAAKIELANDAMTRLGLILKGIGNVLAVELAPFLKEGADSLHQWGVEGKGLKKTFKELFDGMLKSIASVLDGVDKIRVAYIELRLIIQQVAKFGASATAVASRVLSFVAKPPGQKLGGGQLGAIAKDASFFKDALDESIGTDIARLIKLMRKPPRLAERFESGVSNIRASADLGASNVVRNLQPATARDDIPTRQQIDELIFEARRMSGAIGEVGLLH